MTHLQLDAIVSPPCAGVIRYYAPSPSPHNKTGSLGGSHTGGGGGGGGRSHRHGEKSRNNNGDGERSRVVVVRGGGGGVKKGGVEGGPSLLEQEWVLVLTVRVNQTGHVISSITELTQGGDGSGSGGGNGGGGVIEGNGDSGLSGGGLLLLSACEESSPHILKATFTPDTLMSSSSPATGLELELISATRQGLEEGLGTEVDPSETILEKFVPLVVHPASTMIIWPSPLPPLTLGEALSKRVHLNARLVLRNRGDLGITHTYTHTLHTNYLKYFRSAIPYTLYIGTYTSFQY